jgi:guanylate kinase
MTTAKGVHEKQKGLVVVLSAPSGCGKTTVTNRLLKILPHLKRSISVTTRKMRKGEKEGRDYYFFSEEKFLRKQKSGYFLEWAQVFDCYYGTPKDFIYRTIRQGYNVILTIDVQGAKGVRQIIKDGVFIFLAPPSVHALKQRITARGTDSCAEIAKRLSEARREMKCAGEYDYVVINKSLEQTVETISAIIKIEKTKVLRNKEVIRGLYSA